MFFKNLWQNMKIFVSCITWSCITTFMTLLDYVSPIDCKRDSKYSQPEIELLPAQYTWNSSYVEITHNFKDVVFATDACHKIRMVYTPISGIYQGKIIATSDGFQKTAVILHINASFVEVTPVLSDLLFVPDGLLTVINNKLFIFDFIYFLANQTDGIEQADGVDTLNVHSCCSSEFHCGLWEHLVLAYKLYSSTNDFYYSQTGGRQFLHSNLSSTHHTYKILSSTILALDLAAVFLVEDLQTSKLMLMSMPLIQPIDPRDRVTSSSINLLEEFESYRPGDPVHMIQLQSKFYSLLLWDSNKLIYKRRLDYEGVEVLIHQKGDGFTFLTNEYIRHADSNALGEFLMITSHNRLLYGRESYKTEATYVTSLSRSLTNATVVIFDSEGDVILISPKHTLRLEHYSALFLSTVYLPDEIRLLDDVIAQCPYQNIEVEDFHPHYLIDIHETVQFLTRLYTSEWSDVSLLVQVSAGQSFLLLNSLSHSPSTDHGVILLGMRTLIIPSNVTYHGLITENPDSPMESGHGAAIRVVTTSTSLSCADKSQNVAHITLGCEKGKHLSVNREAGPCERLAHGYTYEIPADMYDADYGKYGRNNADVSKTLLYDFRRFGCANKTYYNNPFIFDLHLYNDATYLGPMKGDYVVYEVNGINRFHYSLTVDKSGCLFNPQTWREMLLSAPDNTSLNDIWTRKNYRRCNLSYDHITRSRVHTPSPGDSYEILNYDNGNHLTFTENGLYLFEIIVVDHDYSLCDLRTRLAVEVFGVQPDVPIGYFWIVGSTVAFMAVTFIVAFIIIDVRRRIEIARGLEMDDIEAFEATIKQHLSEPEQRITGLSLSIPTAGVARRGSISLRNRYSLSRRRHSIISRKLSNG